MSEPDTTPPVAPKIVSNDQIHFATNPEVTLSTSLGSIKLELYPEQAPATVSNLLAYIDGNFYDGLIFHRVISNFVIQGGGYNTSLAYQTPWYAPIALESNNGLSNLRGTIAMARTSVPDSANSQFYINQVDNIGLNYKSAASPGYAVFGQVISGIDVVDKIAKVPTFQSVPLTTISILKFSLTQPAEAYSRSAIFSVTDVESGAQWSYSLDEGKTWLSGTGTSFEVPEGYYANGAIQVRQTDAAGNVSLGTDSFFGSLIVDVTQPRIAQSLKGQDAQAFAVDADLKFGFDEAVYSGTGTFTLKTGAGVIVETYDVANSPRLEISADTLIIDPTSALQSATDYIIEFQASSLADRAGNELGGTLSYRFTTAGVLRDVTGTAQLDTIDYGGRTANYAIANDTVTDTAKTGEDRTTDRLLEIERLHFSDASLALDEDGTAGQAYRLYKAAFARTPDLPGLGGWIAAMDAGMSLAQVASAFAGSDEFMAKYGANATTDDFVTSLYLNVMGRAPDTAGLGYWVNQIDSGLQTRAQVLANFSESSENKAAVQAAIANGIFYATDAQRTTALQGLQLEGTSESDALYGSVARDSLRGQAGDDTLQGGENVDTAFYAGNREAYTISMSNGVLTVSGNGEGTDTLWDIERLEFADKILAFDTSGNAGQVYRLYQAAFDRMPDTSGLTDWVRGMDAGMTLRDVAKNFIDSAEFLAEYGENPSADAFITMLYQNVLNRAPDDGGKAYWLDELARGLPREMALIGFSESGENQAALIGQIGNGIELTL